MVTDEKAAVRFSDMGKAAKHQADAVFRASVATNEELQLALVVSVESTLCFILAFLLSDRTQQLKHRPVNIDMWRTFIPLSKFVSEKAKALNHTTLHGFW